MKKRKKFLLITAILCVVLFILLVPLKLPERIMKLIYPIKYENFVEVYAKENNLDKYLVYAVIKAESNFNDRALSKMGTKGLMQLMDDTALDIIKKTENDDKVLSEDNWNEKLFEPQFNIKLGTKYLALLIEKYKNTELALIAYNAGSGNVDKWIEQGILKEDGSNIENVPFKETNNYVRKILNNYDTYKDLYE